MQLQRQSPAQQGLADEQQSQVVGRIHVEVEQQRKLLQSGVAQQMGFIANQNGMLFFALVQTHDGVGDLTDQIPAAARWLQVQFARHLSQ